MFCSNDFEKSAVGLKNYKASDITPSRGIILPDFTGINRGE